MKIYLVGGAVRDRLLHLPARDHDYIVTGSSHAEMLEKNYIPVGKGHTIYLHPETREEYVLADNLKDDLMRRDLTINALAMEEEKIIDYFNGADDIQKKIFRSIRDENFYQDPLRVYRVARMMAQYPDFTIEPATLKLMKKVSQTDEMKSIAGERVLLEFIKALEGKRPVLFFETLESINAIDVHFHAIRDFDRKFFINCCDKIADPLIRFASLFIHQLMDLGPLFHGLHFSDEWKSVALLVARFYSTAVNFSKLKPEEKVNFFYWMDAFRKPHLLDVLSSLLIVSDKKEEKELLNSSFKLINEVSAYDVNPEFTGSAIGEAIKRERAKRLSVPQG